ncbi:nitrogen regulation protein NR(II) [Thalassotalea aquiviva]|uniref:two-component system sensor histidine kinase NtrB n=1 Tax=Thalassotalea aquiviva TaxID=3242415 RepID=UPI00352AAD12
MFKLLFIVMAVVSFNALSASLYLQLLPIHIAALPLFALFSGAFIYRQVVTKKTTRFEVMEFASQPVLLTDNAGNISYLNNAALTLIGGRENDVIGSSIYRLIPQLPSCLQNNQKFRKIKKSELCNCQTISPDQQDFVLMTPDQNEVAISISVLKLKNGSLAFYLSDQRPVNQLQQQLEKQNKAATTGEFLAGILHEVGNPMAAIEGIAYNQLWQLEQGGSDVVLQTLKDDLQLIQQQASRINQIKNEFSQISIHSSDENDLIDIANLTKQLIKLAQFDKRGHNIEFNYQAVTGVPAIRAHKGKLTQILLNIYSNSMDALQQQPNGEINTNISLTEHNLVIEITDTGCGIKAEIIEKIFEPFYTTKEQGTGLGMVICKNLAESMHASLAIDSQVGKFTKVTLSLPLTDRAL